MDILNKRVKLLNYSKVFFVYSFLGFIFESIMTYFRETNFNSGILYGPWTFIYGIAVLIIMVVNRELKIFIKKRQTTSKRTILSYILEISSFYILITIIMGVLEYMGGIIIEGLFHRVYWDYTNMSFNIGRYVALEVLILWGVLATFLNYVVIPRFNKYIYKIPNFVLYIVIFFFGLDIIFSLIN